MSFDIFVQDIPAWVQKVEDIPVNFKPQPIGARSTIIEAIRRVVPEVKFDDLGWGSIDGDGYTVEVNIGDNDPITGFSFHLRGGQKGLFLVGDILAELGLRAFAPGTESGLFRVDRATEALLEWRRFREGVVNR